MNFIYKILCKVGYHSKLRLIEVTVSFGSSGKVEKVKCLICNKIIFRRNSQSNLNPQIIIIIILILLIMLFFL